MQFDHGVLAFRPDGGPQAGRLALFTEAVDRGALAAYDVHLPQHQHASDKRNRDAEEPGEGLAARDCLGIRSAQFDRGGLAGINQRVAKSIERIEQSQKDTGQQGRLEKRAHGHDRRLAQIGQGIGAPSFLCPGLLRHRIEVAGQRAQKNDHDRRGNDLPQSAGGCDHARGDLGAVIVAQHGRQAQEAHGDHCGPHDAG